MRRDRDAADQQRKGQHSRGYVAGEAEHRDLDEPVPSEMIASLAITYMGHSAIAAHAFPILLLNFSLSIRANVARGGLGKQPGPARAPFPQSKPGKKRQQPERSRRWSS